MQIGQSLKNPLKNTNGGYFDSMCDQLNFCNVTNVNAAKNLSVHESGYIILGVVGTQQAVGTGSRHPS